MVQFKQIFGYFDAFIGVGGFTTSAATSTTCTGALTTAFATAAKGGGSVPLQVASGDTEGVLTSKIVEIFDATSKDKIIGDGDGNEVYGKITEAAGVYTLNYHYLDNTGTEQNYTMAGQAIDFECQYRFSLKNLPYDFALSNNISQDVSGSSLKTIEVEQLTITAQDTANNVTVPAGQEVKKLLAFLINGVDEVLNGPTVATNGAVSFAPGTTGYNVETTDKVVVRVELGLI